jgi:hypothetical protein
MWMLPEPMLAEPAPDPALPEGWAAEVKWDGWRALLSWEAGRLVLRSRRGADLIPGFPELHSGAVQLPDATALDREVVVWDSGRLAFERLQGRDAGAARRLGPQPDLEAEMHSPGWTARAEECTSPVITRRSLIGLYQRFVPDVAAVCPGP